MPTEATRIHTVIAGDSGSGIWNPLSRGFSTIDMKEVRLREWFSSLPTWTFTALPAIQFSDDGVDWSATPQKVQPQASSFYSAADGWNFENDTYNDLNASPFDTYQKLFCRFGVYCKTSQAKALYAQARLRVEWKPVRTRTLILGPQVVHSNGTTVDTLSHPMSAWISTENIGQVRVTTEVWSIFGDISLRPYYEVRNEPLDTTSGASDQLESAITTEGIDYPTTFATLTPSRDFIRFGMRATNTSNGAIAAARVRMRVELRD